MAKRLPFIFLIISHLFVSGVTSRNLTIENKCDYTVWPGLYTTYVDSSTSPISSTGFALKKGEARVIHADEGWSGYIWGRTLCAINSTGKFACATGDCNTGEIECFGGRYNSPGPRTLVYVLTLDKRNSYYVSVGEGYNLPMQVGPKQGTTETCKVVSCDVVDLKKLPCPYELEVVDEEERPIACTSPCPFSNNCYTTTPYWQNFKRACPTAKVAEDFFEAVACSESTDYIITFCPSVTPILTRRKSRSSMAESPLPSKTKDGVTAKETTTGEKDNYPLKVILGVASAFVVMIILIVIAVVVRAKNARRERDWNRKNMEEVVMLKQYSYAKVKKMTSSFAHVLGKGGFGTVYKGKLPDGSGRDVAVKVLKELKGNGEEFINEVASMSRTSHVNIVSLLGFCYEGNKRAIIYEFMPNGSLDKFISENMSTKMEWKALYNIAEGVACGLEYLHNRCVSRIVHFDIKPQNILMDEDLCPKISDFGLAKLCKKKQSIMSKLDARGTIGYIAPEVFYRSFGGVSHKSDVYSYGMVILEIIGAKNKERLEKPSSNNSSMYFPDWIYKDLEREETMRLFGDELTEEEEKIVKKMVLVGLWCIQTNPSDRPSMSRVVEMLEGSLEALHVPPKPLFGNIPVSESFEESQVISSFSTLSQLERGTISQDALSFSKVPVRDIVEDNQDGLKSF